MDCPDQSVEMPVMSLAVALGRAVARWWVESLPFMVAGHYVPVCNDVHHVPPRHVSIEVLLVTSHGHVVL